MRTNKIVIVGGGSAGWMTAATLVNQFPNKEIVVIESPNVPTVGVGESTIQGINVWLNMLGIKDTDFMAACDATYKLSIRFEDFYQVGDNGFHYPFGFPVLEESVTGINDWHIKKALYPETPNSSYADSYFSTMALVNANKFDKNLNGVLPGYQYLRTTAFQFDATKFGCWLRDVYCKGRLTHIQAEVIEVQTGAAGVERLVLDNGDEVTADLFIDCTGFKSLLLDKALNVPFESYADMLPNNKAWATRVQYSDKEKQLVAYTNCTALSNGWMWEIPLWSRMGTGYVYSDKHTTDEDAKLEFIEKLKSKGYATDALEFKNISMRTGIHERIWEKNVCAIGLSAGFIEPLESNGLYTVHKFLMNLVRALNRGQSSRFERDSFNLSCKAEFRQFAEFVGMHYALSIRDDSAYWRENLERVYDATLSEPKAVAIPGFKTYSMERYQRFQFNPDGGFHCIAAGMNYNPCDISSLTAYNFLYDLIDAKQYFGKQVEAVGKHIPTWNEAVKNYPTLIEYLQENIYEN
jgi:tryptophan halogenase